MHVCNKCSVFESNEDTLGCVACKSVGYCKPCKKSMDGNPDNVDDEMRKDSNDEDRERTKVPKKGKRYVLKL